MLLLFMEEQQAYWVLSVICEEFFAESYTLDMAGEHGRLYSVVYR